ncbi:MAG: hypothetical protein AAFU67_13185 [Bacteroidota bacterium]
MSKTTATPTVEQINSLISRVEGLEAKNLELEEQLARNKATDSVKRDVAKVVGVEVPEDTFKVGKNTYKFTVGKYIGPGGVRILAKDSLASPRELARLVEIGSEIIVKA